MRVGDETHDIGVGELAFIPPGVAHGIENIGDETLRYVSAATPAFAVEALYDSGPLARERPR
jgi:mannose-6-phosphate isomerase-like protein (cupin superfamily)